jgi:hypothetical protein
MKTLLKEKQMSEKTESLTLSMSPADLTVIASAMEKNVTTLQEEFSALEKRALVIKQEIDRQNAMLAVMKAKLAE